MTTEPQEDFTAEMKEDIINSFNGIEPWKLNLLHKVACNSGSKNIPRTSLDRYGELAYRTAYNPDYATPWDKVGAITKRKYKAMAKAVLTEAGAEYVE